MKRREPGCSWVSSVIVVVCPGFGLCHGPAFSYSECHLHFCREPLLVWQEVVSGNKPRVARLHTAAGLIRLLHFSSGKS